MTVKVTERDDSRMSHEGVAAGVRIWDVYQQDLLVGMFHSETDAHNYKAELETLEQQRALRSA
ncbi:MULTISPECIES: hypothetical protein [Pseudomonas]|jgi:hypothetical protein|uniref:Uncharacterized protein n=1 Tax=Pseudomonas umsongensis TaxID=198618 RepID=A0AAE7A071_9PSED|nr:MULTISPECIES: hypothetical protein [Pseudomonas]MDP9690778.1 hypothetical protein [Pseudomonas mohnii]EPA94593.1 hypothetical protein PG5_49410 [Pseudomonas sp. G5(2012)]MBD0678114.1 hypothetical protein [Pseudomonas sp. PSB11]MCK8686466.1 hypothetical protein [Pseudomonas umsongensis]MDI3392841.1 hypothetical protein [Pseudomonas sp. V98_8]